MVIYPVGCLDLGRLQEQEEVEGNHKVVRTGCWNINSFQIRATVKRMVMVKVWTQCWSQSLSSQGNGQTLHQYFLFVINKLQRVLDVLFGLWEAAGKFTIMQIPKKRLSATIIPRSPTRVRHKDQKTAVSFKLFSSSLPCSSVMAAHSRTTRTR